MRNFRFFAFWLRASFFFAFVILSSIWCVSMFTDSQQAKKREGEIRTFPLSIEYNGSLISSLYERGFDINPPICHPAKGVVRLLILVHSVHSEEDRRQSIRHTWKAFGKMRNVSIAFFLGRATKEDQARKIREESRLHGDIIVSRNVDSFEKLTLKSIGMAEWVSENCREVKYVVKADSDVFLNVPQLFQVIKEHEATNSKKTVFGKLLRDTAPLRENFYKHWVSLVEYPADRYPDYVQGGTYMFTGDLARLQFSVALDMKFFRMEDVFFTGFLSERLGANLVNVEDFFVMLPYVSKTTRKDTSKEDFDVCTLRRFVAVHHGDYSTMFHLWQLTNYKSVKCSCSCL